MERWLSVKEIAEHLGLSKETIYRMLKAETIPAYKVGRQWKFKASEVDNYLKLKNPCPVKVFYIGG